MTLVERIYDATAKFPTDERYGLTSQIRRAAISVPSNVAEGYCRRATKPYAHHVSIALGSHAELETCLDLAVRLRILAPADHARLETMLRSVGSLLSGPHRSLKEKIEREHTARRRPPSPNG